MLHLALLEGESIMVGPGRDAPAALLVEVLDADMARLLLGQKFTVTIMGVDLIAKGRSRVRFGLEGPHSIRFTRSELVDGG